MNLGELETLTTYDIPVKVLLLNNLGDGMVRQWQDLFYSSRYSGSDKSLHKKDFVRAVAADGFGFAKRVTKNDDVRAHLEEFVKFDGPAFLEVMVDQTRPRLPDGRSRPRLQGHDHRQVHPEPREAPRGRHAGARRVLLSAMRGHG